MTLLASCLGWLSVAHADGDGALGPFATMDVAGGVVTVLGAGTAGRTPGRPVEGVSLELVVPDGAAVHRAYLYVNTLGADGTEAIQVQFQGAPILLDRIGTGPATCWGPENLNRVYRADVTDVVPGSGTYDLAGFPSSNQRRDDSQGLALVVVTTVPDSDDITRVWIADGALALDNPADLLAQFDTLLVPDATHGASVHVAVGDGQHDNSALYFGETVLSENAFPGAQGALYDVRSHSVLELLPARTPNATLRVTSPLDCLSWNVAVMTVSAPADADSDGDGVPDWTDECPFIPNPCEPEPDPEPDVGMDLGDAGDAGDADLGPEDASDADSDADLDADADGADVDDAGDAEDGGDAGDADGGDADPDDVAPDLPEDLGDDLGSTGDTQGDEDAADIASEPAPALLADGGIFGGGGCATVGAPSGGGALLVLVAVALGHLRRRRRGGILRP